MIRKLRWSSSSPMEKMSTMLWWPISLTDRASSTKRATALGSWAKRLLSTLMATRLRINGWTPA